MTFFDGGNEMKVVNHIREIENGVTRPSIAEASDGKKYVIKYLNEDMNVRGLYNEYVAYQLGKALDIPMPHQELLDLDADFIRKTESIHYKNPRTCTCIASEYHTGNVKINPVILKNITNQIDIPGIVLFDQLILNNDRSANPGNLFYDKKTKKLLALDHSHIFKDGLICNQNTLKRVLDSGPCIVDGIQGANYSYVSKYINGHSPFEAFISKAKKIDLDLFFSIMKQIPADWNISPEEIEINFKVIEMQIKNVEEVVRMLKPHFPYWKG